MRQLLKNKVSKQINSLPGRSLKVTQAQERAVQVPYPLAGLPRTQFFSYYFYAPASYEGW